MSANSTSRIAELATVLARWLLGALFIYMGLQKALHPVEFLKLVHEYDLVRQALPLNLIAALLPWFEVYCGLLLLLGIAARGAACLSLAMLLPFTALVIRRALQVQALQQIPFCAVKFDCGCGLGEVLICHKIAENCALILLSAWVAGARSRLLCARHALWTKSPA